MAGTRKDGGGTESVVRLRRAVCARYGSFSVPDALRRAPERYGLAVRRVLRERYRVLRERYYFATASPLSMREEISQLRDKPLFPDTPDLIAGSYAVANMKRDGDG